MIVSQQEQAIGSEIIKLSMPYDTMDTQYHWPQLINLGQPLVNYAMPTMEQIMTIIYTSAVQAPKVLCIAIAVIAGRHRQSKTIKYY